MLKKLLLSVRRFLICLVCLAGFLVPWPGVWWRWPAAWLFLYASGIGARLKRVPLPRPLRKRVMAAVLISAARWGNHARLYYAKKEGQFTDDGWFLVGHNTIDKDLPAVYFVAGCFAARFEQEGEKLYLHYKDEYDWHLGIGYEFNLPRFITAVLSLILPVVYDRLIKKAYGVDDEMPELGRPFITEGRIRVEFPISAGALFFMGVPIVDVTEY